MLDQSELLAFARRMTSEVEIERYWSLKTGLKELSDAVRDLSEKVERLEKASIQNQWSTALENLWRNHWLKIVFAAGLWTGNTELIKAAGSLLK